MGRAERRKWNKKHGIKLSDKEKFDVALAWERIQSGNFNLNGLNIPRDFMHVDNDELAPEGTICKLNYNMIKERIEKSPDSFEQWYKDLIEKFKDQEVHLTRDGASQSLVCIAEDDREVELDGKMVKAPKALFDVYSDLLFKNERGEWLMLSEIDTSLNGYSKVDNSVVENIENKMKNNEKGEENNEKGEESNG